MAGAYLTAKQFNRQINMKKTFAMRLRERTDTIEFRSIKTKLQAIAQNKNSAQEYRALHLRPETITQLQNEGITVKRANEFGYDKYLLTWAVTPEQRLAERIKWEVCFNDRHISVPEKELEEAENNCFVAELRDLGFHIQSAIA